MLSVEIERKFKQKKNNKNQVVLTFSLYLNFDIELNIIFNKFTLLECSVPTSIRKKTCKIKS